MSDNCFFFSTNGTQKRIERCGCFIKSEPSRQGWGEAFHAFIGKRGFPCSRKNNLHWSLPAQASSFAEKKIFFFITTVWGPQVSCDSNDCSLRQPNLFATMNEKRVDLHSHKNVTITTDAYLRYFFKSGHLSRDLHLHRLKIVILFA